MQQRRILFSVGVTYDTPPDTVERIPEMIREAVESQDLTRFDRAHFSGYGDSSLDMEIVYYVLSGEYTVYMDIQQGINLALLRRFGDDLEPGNLLEHNADALADYCVIVSDHYS